MAGMRIRPAAQTWHHLEWVWHVVPVMTPMHFFFQRSATSPKSFSRPFIKMVHVPATYKDRMVGTTWVRRPACAWQRLSRRSQASRSRRSAFSTRPGPEGSLRDLSLDAVARKKSRVLTPAASRVRKLSLVLRRMYRWTLCVCSDSHAVFTGTWSHTVSMSP